MCADNVEASFDFIAHEQAAVSEYLRRQPFYNDLASVVSRIVQECLTSRNIRVHSVQHRAKEAGSFGRKAATPSDKDPNMPKYVTPLAQITDLSGVRVIAHLPGTLLDIDRLIKDEFDIAERSDKSEQLIETEKFGYRSIHYLVRINQGRVRLAEYERFANTIAEIQVRTILQHTWAEIEHDIQYKSATLIPSEIRRRFMALAGMLEIADREFQAIQDADREIESHAQTMVEQGSLDGIEITTNSLRSFLNKRVGPDGRISDWTYDWTARLLKRLGFSDLKQVENAVARYDDYQLSNIGWGGSRGQTSRFEAMLLAALGEDFIKGHTFYPAEWFVSQQETILRRYSEKGIEINNFKFG